MNRVEPIWEDIWVKEFARYFKKTNTRNYMIFMCGIHTGLRISDILSLKKSDIRGLHLTILEQKSKKLKRIVLHPTLQKELSEYTANMRNADYLFPSRKCDYRGRQQPIGRGQAHVMLKEASKAIGYTGNISTHSLRKTFGLRYYRQYKDVAELKEIFNHTDEAETYRYLGIMRERIEENIVNLKGIDID